MKLYIRSNEDTDENEVEEQDEGQLVNQYHDFCVEHNRDLDNYLKKKLESYFGVSPYKYEVNIGKVMGPSWEANFQLKVYAELDVVTSELTPECADHVTYGKGFSPDFDKLGYEDGKFYAIIYNYYYPSYPKDGDLNSLDYAYKYIDSCLSYYTNAEYFIQNLDDVINSVQSIYDEFKDELDLQFTIRRDGDADIRAYQKGTDYIVYDGSSFSSAFTQEAEDKLQKALDKYVYSSGDDITQGEMRIYYDTKKVKYSKELRPSVERLAGKAYNYWDDCMLKVTKPAYLSNILCIDIIASSRQDFQEIYEYLYDNISKFDVSIEIMYGNYNFDFRKKFDRIYGE